MGKTLSLPLSISNRDLFFLPFAPLFCTLTDKEWRAQSGVKDILCRPAVPKDKMRPSRKGQRHPETRRMILSPVKEPPEIMFKSKLFFFIEKMYSVGTYF